ncbi:MAG: hypothetical protein Q8S00_13655, partial [Deltaproteobacteria bacterium]|nr:hypothetical protein [Deltaproteobacteria bacterium]
PRQPYANPVSWAPMNAHKVPSRSMAIENLMNSQKTALLRPRVLQEAHLIIYLWGTGSDLYISTIVRRG